MELVLCDFLFVVDFDVDGTGTDDEVVVTAPQPAISSDDNGSVFSIDDGPIDTFVLE